MVVYSTYEGLHGAATLQLYRNIFKEQHVCGAELDDGDIIFGDGHNSFRLIVDQL